MFEEIRNKYLYNKTQIVVLDKQGVVTDLVTDGILVPVDESVMPEIASQVRELKLETTEVLAEVAPGITFNYCTFNNTVPGPLFRVREGDVVKVTIHNKERLMKTVKIK